MKKIINMFFCLIMVFSIVNTSCIFVYAEESVESWSYDTKTNTLTISGIGETHGFIDADKTYFYDVENLIIKDGVTIIGEDAFFKCENLKSVKFPDSLVTIKSNAFRDTGLTEVTIPKNVSLIKDCAFSTESLEIINMYAKNVDCSSLAFWNTSVYKVNIDNLSNWCSHHFSLSSSNPLEYADLYLDDEIVTDLIIPYGVKNINVCAFRSCRSIESVRFSSTVEKIEANSFRSCSNLKTVYIPHNVKYIAYTAFSYNNNLKDIYYEGTKEEFINLFSQEPSLSMYTIVHYLNDHEHNFEAINVVAPKCNTTGYTKYECTICGDQYRGDITDKLGHDFELYTVISPSCTDDETEIYLCSRKGCTVSYSSPILNSALGHEYVTQIIQPTHTDDGYIRYSCLRCSDAYIIYPEELKSTGHDYNNYVSANNGIITYACSCENVTITKSVDEIIDMWNVDFINDSADKCPQLDVIQDGIINAKDYAKLNHIKNFGY